MIHGLPSLVDGFCRSAGHRVELLLPAFLFLGHLRRGHLVGYPGRSSKPLDSSAGLQLMLHYRVHRLCDGNCTKEQTDTAPIIRHSWMLTVVQCA